MRAPAMLTTLRKSAEDGRADPKARYHWDGKRFALQEMRWQDCGAADRKARPSP